MAPSLAGNLGPLTAAWTPPSSCTIPFNFCTDSECTGIFGATCARTYEDDCTDSRASCTSSFTYVGYDDPDCWPPRSSSISLPTDILLSGWGYYSPGILCPAGHTSACFATAGGHSDWQPQIPLQSDETAAGCCPSSFVCGISDGIPTCINTARASSGFAMTCVSTGSAFEPQTIPTTITSGTEEITINSRTLYAPLIQINWKATDRTSTSSYSAPSEAPSETSTADPSQQNSLSTGAKTGIGIGVGVAVLALVGVLSWLLVRYRRSRQSGNNESYMPPAEPPAVQQVYQDHQIHQLEGQQKYELSGNDGHVPGHVYGGYGYPSNENGTGIQGGQPRLYELS
ncbi:hypothetical protein M426DRAFT_12783 [Hypoxylon sp. CI-4A]|nr:hypothetical protein M426DRAFT_12783 [Hypoxylon sp. CI-4A]